MRAACAGGVSRGPEIETLGQVSAAAFKPRDDPDRRVLRGQTPARRGQVASGKKRRVENFDASLLHPGAINESSSLKPSKVGMALCMGRCDGRLLHGNGLDQTSVHKCNFCQCPQPDIDAADRTYAAEFFTRYEELEGSCRL